MSYCDKCGVLTKKLYLVRESLRTMGINHFKVLRVCGTCKKHGQWVES